MADNKDDWEDLPVKDDWEDVSDTGADGPHQSGAQATAHGIAGMLPFGKTVSAAIRATGSKLANPSGPAWSDAYKAAQTEFERQDEQGKKEHPGLHALGSGLGFASTLAIPGGAAAQGALYGAGDADLTSPSDILTKTAMGAAGGKVLGIAGEKVGAPIARFLSEKLNGTAGLAAYKAAGGMLRDVRQAGGIKRAAEVGNKLLDTGMVKAGNTVEGIAAKLGPARKAAGEAIGNAKVWFDALEGKYNPAETADRIESEVVGPLSQSPADQELASTMQGEADKFRAMGDDMRPLSELAKFRQRYDAHGKAFRGPLGQSTPSSDAYKGLRDVLDRHFDEEAARASPDLAARYNELQADYALFKPAQKMAEDMASRKQANNKVLSLSNLLSANLGEGIGSGLGLASGGPVGAIAGGVAAHLAKTRGASTVAAGARGASRAFSAISKQPQLMGRFAPALTEAASRGENAFMAAHHAMAERNPDYRTQFAQVQKQTGDQDE